MFLRVGSPRLGAAATALLWRLRFFWFACVITLPTIPAPLLADDAHALYTDAATFRGSFYEATSFAVRETPLFATRGNFRPLGRLFGEHIPHMLTWETSVRLGTTPSATYTLARLVAATVLGWSFFLACRVFRAPIAASPKERRSPSRPNLLEAGSLGLLALLIAPYGSASSSLVFVPAYLGATSLVLLTCVAVVRLASPELTRTRLTQASALVGLAVAGWAVSWWNELAFTAAAAAVCVLAGAALNQKSSVLFRNCLAYGLGLTAGMAWARIAINRAGSPLANRYEATSFSLSWSGIRVFGNRLVAGSPVGALLELDAIAPALGIAAIAASAAAVWVMTCGSKTRQNLRPGDRVWIAAFGLALVFAAAAVPAVSSAWQLDPHISFRSWRETVTGRVGWLFLISAAVSWVRDRKAIPGTRLRTWFGAAAVAMCAIIATVGAGKTARSLAATPINTQMIRAGGLLMHMPDSRGEQERCAVSRAISAAASTYHPKQVPVALEQIAFAEWGRRFCSTVPIPG